MQAGNKRTIRFFYYNLGIRLWIFKLRTFRLIFHKSVAVKFRLRVFSLADAFFTPLQLSCPVSFNATSVACSLLLFIIELTIHQQVNHYTLSYISGQIQNIQITVSQR
jgi:hypothetical protein